MRDGEPEIADETIRRRMEESKRGDALAPLFQILHQAAILEVRKSDDMFGELRRERVQQIAEDLERVIALLEETRALLKRKLGKPQPVS